MTGDDVFRAVKAATAFANLPCVRITYDGEAEAYFAVNADAVPDDFADDEPQHDRWLVQLHLFAPFTQNTTALRKQIRRAIFAAGFSYPAQIEAGESARSADGTEQHVVFEFETATEVD